MEPSSDTTLAGHQELMTDAPELPKKTVGDAVYALAKASIGSVPVVGAAGAELFAYVVSEPFEKRRERWMTEVGDALAALRESGAINVDVLRDDPAFADTVLAATQAALRTNESAKHAALHNAILNSALAETPDVVLRHTFVRLVDELTTSHLQLLDRFDDPYDWHRRTGRPYSEGYPGGVPILDERVSPEVQWRRDLTAQWWRDLQVRGLVGSESLQTVVVQRGSGSRCTTDLGRAFLAFIRAPARAAS